MAARLAQLEDTAEALRLQILGLLEIQRDLVLAISDIRREIESNNIAPEPQVEPAPLRPLPKAKAKSKSKKTEKDRVKLYTVNRWKPDPYRVGIYRRRWSEILDIFDGNPNSKGGNCAGFETDDEVSAVNYWYQRWESEPPRF